MVYMNERDLNKKIDTLVGVLLEKTQTGEIKWTRRYDGEFPFEYEHRTTQSLDYSIRVAMGSRDMYPRYSFSVWNGANTVYEDCHSTAEEPTWLEDKIEELFIKVQLADPEVMATLDRVIESINKAIEKDK